MPTRLLSPVAKTMGEGDRPPTPASGGRVLPRLSAECVHVLRPHL